MAKKRSQWLENRRRMREGKSLRKKGGRFAKPRNRKRK
jgi:hypothetical protein